MLLMSLRQVLRRKLRLALTTFCIVIGVAFVSGAQVFADSINQAFDELFTNSYQKTDIVVTSKGAAQHNTSVPLDDSIDPKSLRVPASVLTTVSNVDGVQSAQGNVAGMAQIIGKDGKPIGGQGPPTLGFSWDPVESLSPLKVTRGSAPDSADEIAIDVDAARKGKYEVGDSVRIVTALGTERFRLSGLVGFGAENTLLGATLAVFELTTAQRLFEADGMFDAISIAAKSGVSASKLKKRIDRELPADYVVRTGQQEADSQLKEISEGIDFLRYALIAFAAIALFVGAFIIFNTFAITVAQRAREMGLLRAIGATRLQIVRAVVVEGMIIGFIASVIGVVTGLGVSLLIREGLQAGNFDVPSGKMSLQLDTILIGLAVGIGVTAAASLVPAVRASRVSPIDAINDVQVSTPKLRLRRVLIGVVITGAGSVLVAMGLMGTGALAAVASQLGAGFVVIILGLAILAPLVVPPAASVVGAPFKLMGKIVGMVAVRNTVRDPQRTASTAAALMVGVALVCFASIFTASIEDSFSRQLDENFATDFMITNSSSIPRFSAKVAQSISDQEGIDAAGIKQSSFTLHAKSKTTKQYLIAAFPNELSGILNIDANGVQFQDLRDNSIWVSEAQAEKFGWDRGDIVNVEFPDRKKPVELPVSGIFEPIWLGDFLISAQTLQRYGPPRVQQDAMVLIHVDDDVLTSAARVKIEKALIPYPNLTLQDNREMRQQVSKGLNQLRGLLIGLLSLSLIIAVIGIAITLALSMIERTREIGLLRAVGMTRRQVRRMTIVESIVTASIGTLLGIALGISLGLAGVQALSQYNITFTLPVGWVVALTAFGVVAGVIAAIVPAIRAGRLGVLDAISHN